jgi:KUP system potassium uptake protein
LRQLPGSSQISDWTIIYIVLGILTVLFFLQQFGTASIGKLFGPIMSVWFIMMGLIGISHISDDWSIFKAFSPHYAINLLANYPKGFWILGAVFLCTTGAEALYSDLGHCGKWNIRYSWIFVKTCLIVNYLGQGAWLIANYKNQVFDVSTGNPFFSTMPEWFRLFGIIIATAAAVIASQALISGSFTLVSEAMRLNLWPNSVLVIPQKKEGNCMCRGLTSFCFLAALAWYFISKNQQIWKQLMVWP